MAIIKEFRAMMYNGETVGDISSVIAPHCHAEEQQLILETYGNHPFNVMRLEYPEETVNGNKYAGAAEKLGNWLDTGIVRIDEKPAIYIHEQEFELEGKMVKNRGIVCKVKIEEGSLIPHEETASGSYGEYKSDRYNLMTTTGTVFSSVFALYKDETGEVAENIETKTVAETEFTDCYGVVHRVWAIRDEERIESIKKLFKDKSFVIADGHIRYETAASYYKKMKDTVVEYTGEEEFNYVLMSLMPVGENSPVIKPVHRLLKNKNIDEEELIKKLEEDFEISKTYIREYDCEKITAKLNETKEQHSIVMYTGKDYYYLLIPEAESLNSFRTVSELLHKKILCKIFGVNSDNFKTYVEYANSVEEGERAVREGKATCAFYLNPVSSLEMYTLAECGACMPKRTNCFYPRLMTGIIMDKFDE